MAPVGTDFIFSRYWGGGATYSSSNTEESAVFRLFRLKEEGGRKRLKRPRRSHGQLLW